LSSPTFTGTVTGADASFSNVNTSSINNTSNIVLTAPIVEIQNTNNNYVKLNYQNLGTNYITGVRNYISSSDSLTLTSTTD